MRPNTCQRPPIRNQDWIRATADEDWVQENMQKDRDSHTTDRGVKPYPFGNYSLGAVGF